MAILNKLTAACLKSFGGDRRNQQMFFIARVLHKSAASETFGMSTAGEQAVPETLIAPTDVGEKKTSIKTLKEMPGPGTLANLVEFFWRDGFSRIHEIQVFVSLFSRSFISVVVHRIKSRLGREVRLLNGPICHMCVKWHRPLRKSAPGVGARIRCPLQGVRFVIIFA